MKFPNIPLCRTIAISNFFGGRLRVRDSECWLYKKNELKNIYKIEKSQIYKKKWNFRIFRYIEQSLSRTFLAVAWELEIANVDCIRKMNWKIYIRSKSHKYIKKKRNFRIFRYVEQSLSRTFLAVAWELEIANVDCIRKMNWKIYIRSKSHKYIKKNEISEYSAISNNRYLELFWRSPES